MDTREEETLMVEFCAITMEHNDRELIKMGLPKGRKVYAHLTADVCQAINHAQIPIHKVDVIVNEEKYNGCYLHQKKDGLYALGMVKPLIRAVGLGQTFNGTIEKYVFDRSNFETMDKAVLDWEQGEGKAVMRKVGIKEGDVVVDFGCGYGHYTIPCALAMNNIGKVYAIDTGGRELNWIAQKCDMFGINNVEVIRTKGQLTLDMPDNSADFILLYDVLHHWESDAAAKHAARLGFFQEAHRVLKPNGTLSTVNFESEGDKKYAKEAYFGKPMAQVFFDEIMDAGFVYMNDVEGAVHFDWYHSAHRVNKGLQFSQLETGEIYNFAKT